jgi:diguanylate cyclase (GGDEF)-like protein
LSDSWAESLRELREEYVRRSPERLAEIDALLARAGEEPGHGETMDALRLKFHAIAGTAGTFGFMRATELARHAETLVEKDREERGELSADARRALATALRDLRAVFETTREAPVAPERPKSTAQAAQGARILVAADEPELRAEVRRLVARVGIEAAEVPTPEALFAALRSGLPDGLVVAARFHGAPGAAVVERVRALPGGEAPAVLVVGSGSGFFDRIEALHAGADAVFERPLDEQGFLRRLGALLEREQAEPSRVLSVEDDPDQASFVKNVLEAGGHVVRVCGDPAHFEADVIAFRPDLVLLDVNLPGVSGYDLARFLRQNEAHAALPVVFLTGEGRDDARIRSVRAGGDDHLVKPVAPGLLLSTVTARLERARTLRGLLTRDGLTGLTNHTAFLEGLRTDWKRHDRSPARSLSLVSLDLDLFKSVNDRFGHPAGDRVLAALGALLRRRLRGTDLLGRLGGEEFSIVLEDLRADEAVTLLNRLLDDFSRIEFTAEGVTFHVTFSAGISFLAAGMSLEAWRSSADEALYAAKRAGRARVVLAPGAGAASS